MKGLKNFLYLCNEERNNFKIRKNMKKFILLIVLATISLVSMNAQVKYHSELNLSTYTCLPSIELETIQGVTIGDNLSVGAGVGLVYVRLDEESPQDDATIFANAKYYQPVNFPIKPFASLSSGVMWAPWHSWSRPDFFANLGVGAMWRKLKLQVDCSYGPRIYPGSDFTCKIGIGFVFTAKKK